MDYQRYSFELLTNVRLSPLHSTINSLHLIVWLPGPHFQMCHQNERPMCLRLPIIYTLYLYSIWRRHIELPQNWRHLVRQMGGYYCVHSYYLSNCVSGFSFFYLFLFLFLHLDAHLMLFSYRLYFALRIRSSWSNLDEPLRHGYTFNSNSFISISFHIWIITHLNILFSMCGVFLSSVPVLVMSRAALHRQKSGLADYEISLMLVKIDPKVSSFACIRSHSTVPVRLCSNYLFSSINGNNNPNSGATNFVLDDFQSAGSHVVFEPGHRRSYKFSLVTTVFVNNPNDGFRTTCFRSLLRINETSRRRDTDPEGSPSRERSRGSADKRRNRWRDHKRSPEA